jgi:hypothetical protein
MKSIGRDGVDYISRFGYIGVHQSALYNQNFQKKKTKQNSMSFYTSLVVDGVRHQIMKGNEIYRSRWFGDIDGWPKPSRHKARL